ncbi:hypothetical protein AB0M02_28485 [Actinoplanes sp. NPDC051861]|uniref:hypothetical protein n=1 Tax=Actinoplanes sp. NPDC051861 TaxID=3155170 RepID=UPI003423BE90
MFRRRMSALALLALVGGCSLPGDDPRIVVDGEFVGGRFPLSEHSGSQVSSAGMVSICLNSGGSVTVDRVEPWNVVGELKVDGFAIVPADQPDGDSHVVDHECGEPEHLRLTVHPVGEGSAVADGFTLHYTSGGSPYEFRLPWGLHYCAPGDETAQPCRNPG